MHKLEVKNCSRWGRHLLRLSQGLLSLALGLLGGSVFAQDASRLLSVPPPLAPEPSPFEKRVGREIHYDLELNMVKGTIYNPSTGKDNFVQLRAYTPLDENQRPNQGTHKFIAPLINMKPGETARITLHNNLDPEEQGGCTNHDNRPNCFNTTNLHVHGLWVSPSGNSDNVLMEIKPKTTFQYEYNVPEDHPAGTYWYHPHVHGSTAVQVGSGMAGALIIRGDRVPEVGQKGEIQATGDLDTLLKLFEPKSGINDYPEVLLFQQIPYACFDEKKQIKTNPEGTEDPGRWACGDEDVGKVSDFGSQMGAGKWRASGRHTSINGIVQPDIRMKAKQVYRWRLIDAGIHESIGLTIRRLDPSIKWPAKLTDVEEKDFIETKCKSGTVVPQFEVAADGLTREQLVKRETNMLQPGYRSDVLFAFPSEGTYCLYDAASSTSLNADDPTPEGPKLLGRVIVKGGGTLAGEPETFIKAELKKAARMAFTGAVRKKVVADLEQLKTTAFVPHKSFSTEELAGMSEVCSQDGKSGQGAECVTFNVRKRDDPNRNYFEINGASFGEAAARTRILHLGKSQKWVLTSQAGSHPFHIHVNPFQVVQILKKDGTTGDYKEIDYWSKDEIEYADVKGTWKDTLIVKKDYKVIIATQYKRYIGDFVLHCHLLDHEDRGMMQAVRIVHIDAEGKPVFPAHQSPSAQNHP
jgi:L-ascorbate oxidase